MTTTLPLSEESRMLLPEDSEIVNSGDLRGAKEGSVAKAVAAEIRTRRTSLGIILRPYCSAIWLDIIPLLRDLLHFRFCSSGSIHYAELAGQRTAKHFGNKERVESFHPCWTYDARRTEVRGPMQRVF